MWTDTTRVQYARTDIALPSDLTDAEWALLEPFLPPPSHVGRPRTWPLRRIVAAIQYLLRGGLPWRMLPPCFPPVSTVRRWFYLWRDNLLRLSLNHALLLIGREATGRAAWHHCRCARPRGSQPDALGAALRWLRRANQAGVAHALARTCYNRPRFSTDIQPVRGPIWGPHSSIGRNISILFRCV